MIADVVSVGDLTTPVARARRAAWMERFDVGHPPPAHPAPAIAASLVRIGDDDHPVPTAAAALVGPAALAGWHVELYFSRGTALLASGKPGRRLDVVSVRAYRFPAERAAVTWMRPTGRPRSDWEAGGGWLWAPGRLPRAVGVAAVKAVLAGAAYDPDAAVEERPAHTRGACQVCATMVAVNNNGTLRVHGPKDNRCPGGGRPPLAVGAPQAP